MAEYIEREAAIEKLNKLCDRVCQYSKAQRKYMCGACPLGDAFTVIEDDIPAADVQPVRHGRWMKSEYDGSLHVLYVCSQCGSPIGCDKGTPKENGLNFCPNCGAKMDGGET